MKEMDRIEAILAELEQLDAESAGKFRQGSDREAFDIVSRIERHVMQNRNNREAVHG